MAGEAGSRHRHIDWARGLAVLIMMEAHSVDSWTREADRHGTAFANALILGGFAAPLFLFLAGVGVALSAGSRLRKTGSVDAASRAVQRRGWEVLALAFLFRLQEYLVYPGSPPMTLLRVDILNIMGPSIVAAAVVWKWARSRIAGTLALAGLAAAVALLAPLVRTAPLLDSLPIPLEWYLRPVGNHSNFTLFPWSGFVFAGAATGVWIDVWRTAPGRAARWLAGAGVTLAAAGYGASCLPTIYSDSSFWTTSPAFFLLRVGSVISVIPVAYLWSLRPRLLARSGWSPVEELGRASLFVYWVHTDLVYGLPTLPLHRSLTLGWWFLAYALLCLVMYCLAIVKNLAVARWRRGRDGPSGVPCCRTPAVK
jgi:uncharacterized membrane protein